MDECIVYMYLTIIELETWLHRWENIAGCALECHSFNKCKCHQISYIYIYIYIYIYTPVIHWLDLAIVVNGSGAVLIAKLQKLFCKLNLLCIYCAWKLISWPIKRYLNTKNIYVTFSKNQIQYCNSNPCIQSIYSFQLTLFGTVYWC